MSPTQQLHDRATLTARARSRVVLPAAGAAPFPAIAMAFQPFDPEGWTVFNCAAILRFDSPPSPSTWRATLRVRAIWNGPSPVIAEQQKEFAFPRNVNELADYQFFVKEKDVLAQRLVAEMVIENLTNSPASCNVTAELVYVAGSTLL